MFSNFKDRDLYISSMGSIISEIVNNVDDHTNNNRWYIVGNVIPKDEYNNSSIRLTIMNYGNTISSNFKKFMSNTKFNTNSQQNLIKRICDNLIDINGNNYDNNQSLTFAAIQQGISSKMEDNENKGKRGSGIYKLYRELEKISNKDNINKDNCIIISGDTMIKFNNKYTYKKSNEISDNLYQLCFNKENSILKHQDKNCITKLSKEFPGTLLYIEFDFKKKLINE